MYKIHDLRITLCLETLEPEGNVIIAEIMKLVEGKTDEHISLKDIANSYIKKFHELMTILS